MEAPVQGVGVTRNTSLPLPGSSSHVNSVGLFSGSPDKLISFLQMCTDTKGLKHKTSLYKQEIRSLRKSFEFNVLRLIQAKLY